MISKEQEQPNRRYLAIFSLPNSTRRYKVILSLTAIAKKSQVAHDIEELQAEQTSETTSVLYTWQSGNLDLKANAFYNEQNILTKITVEISDYTRDEKPIKNFFSFLEIINELTISLKPSEDFTVHGYMMLKMPSAYPDDVLLFLDAYYGKEPNQQHIEGGVLLIKHKLSSVNLVKSLIL